MSLRKITLLKDKIEDFDSYPFSLPFIRHMDQLYLEHPVTFFVGENGSGKSTLLEGIAYQCGFHTAGGSRNNSYEVDQADSALGKYLRLSWLPKLTNGFFLRAESFYQFASHIDDVDSTHNYGGKSLHHQSHGESFLTLFTQKFTKAREQSIYLLDEPEAALSPARQLSLMRIIKDLSPRSQFIIATHSPILLGYPNAEIISFDQDRLQPIDYQDTDHYQITRRFLENPKRILDELFNDND
ncbi:putative ATPase [Paenibacillus sp. SORGH_AS306]|uniref:AAA family ATPase n=1 Tax=unclassified Paenibacillus TaxID=185978 RepID=UPI00277EE733|nr:MULTISPECIES: AAA family ATPase [unclassified Paenibacillus]MDQ1233825.1 putative ATPase [Paenibacillus sp. SORGH_AS_0306]MDR6110870.1 putative ATPase [Paenibacillus sp. SORGH_AS_0338]